MAKGKYYTPEFKEQAVKMAVGLDRSEEHTSELQSQSNLVCRLLLEKKKNTHVTRISSQIVAHITHRFILCLVYIPLQYAYTRLIHLSSDIYYIDSWSLRHLPDADAS